MEKGRWRCTVVLWWRWRRWMSERCALWMRETLVYIGKNVTAPNSHNPLSSRWRHYSRFKLHNLSRWTESSKDRVSRFSLAQIVREEKQNACTRVSANFATRKLNPSTGSVNVKHWEIKVAEKTTSARFRQQIVSSDAECSMRATRMQYASDPKCNMRARRVSLLFFVIHPRLHKLLD